MPSCGYCLPKETLEKVCVLPIVKCHTIHCFYSMFLKVIRPNLYSFWESASSYLVAMSPWRLYNLSLRLPNMISTSGWLCVALTVQPLSLAAAYTQLTQQFDSNGVHDWRKNWTKENRATFAICLVIKVYSLTFEALKKQTFKDSIKITLPNQNWVDTF